MSKEKKDQSTPEKPIDFQAINPRYQARWPAMSCERW